MKNLMKEYLGDCYSSNHLKNYCNYWMEFTKGSGDEFRKNMIWIACILMEI